jgi:hypothetical protein
MKGTLAALAALACVMLAACGTAETKTASSPSGTPLHCVGTLPGESYNIYPGEGFPMTCQTADPLLSQRLTATESCVLQHADQNGQVGYGTAVSMERQDPKAAAMAARSGATTNDVAFVWCSDRVAAP